MLRRPLHILFACAAFAIGAAADAQRSGPLPAPEAPGAQRITSRISDTPAQPEGVFDRAPRAALLLKPASNQRSGAGELRLLRDYAFDGATIIAHDIDGRPLTAPLDHIGALICSPLRAVPPITAGDDADDPPGRRGVLELVDGQRLSGRLISDAGAEDEIAWRCDLRGAIAAPLDAVASLRFNQATAASSTGRHAVDELHLANGDTLFGTVVHFSDTVTVDTGGAELSLPADRIERIHFANAMLERSGPIAWLSGGGAAHIASITQSPDDDSRNALRLSLASGRRGDTTLGRLLAITDARTPLVPLSSLEMIEQTPREENEPWAIEKPRIETPDPWSPFALAGARDIILPGAGRLGYRLPERARLLTGVVAAPQRGWRWSDATVTIWIDRRPAARMRIDQSTPESEFIIPIAPGSRELLITLSPGAAGEAQAFAVLRTPMLTLDAK
ncbi:MAG: hypothetical protein EA376_04125 [Phycisphaeraceae bacterium]|nr:MAG: hypothetical protein EA376_04125 [Phycisphaeraceae bacterium]